MRASLLASALALAAAGCFDFDRVRALDDAGAPVDAALSPACTAHPAWGGTWTKVAVPLDREGYDLVGLVPGPPVLALGYAGIMLSEEAPTWRQVVPGFAGRYQAGLRLPADRMLTTFQEVDGSWTFTSVDLAARTTMALARLDRASEPRGIALSDEHYFVGSYVDNSNTQLGLVTIFPRSRLDTPLITNTERAIYAMLGIPQGVLACGYGYLSQWDAAQQRWRNDLVPQLPNPGCASLAATTRSDGGIRLWAVSGSETVDQLCTLDDTGGTWGTWSCAVAPFHGEQVAAAPCDEDAALIAGIDGKVAYTTDRGGQFTPIPPGPTSLFNAAHIAPDGAIYVAGVAGALFVRR